MVKAMVCKTVIVGSNPSSTSQSANHLVHGSIAQLAEQTALNRMVAGSTPATPTWYARLHHLVVRTPLCQGGDGSSILPGVVVRLNRLLAKVGFCHVIAMLSASVLAFMQEV